MINILDNSFFFSKKSKEVLLNRGPPLDSSTIYSVVNVTRIATTYI